MRVKQLQENVGFRRDWNRAKKSLAAQVTLDQPDPHLGDGVYIDLISTAGAQRGQGHGTQAMNTLMKIADRHSIDLFLSPEALGQGRDGALSQQALEKWYKRQGFEPVENDDRVWVRRSR